MKYDIDIHLQFKVIYMYTCTCRAGLYEINFDVL